MSREQEYFPPKGTRWEWGAKALNSSPWTSNFARQKEPGLFLWPVSVDMVVDLRRGTFHWTVEVTDWTHGRLYFGGQAGDALQACLAAEEVAEAELAKLLPDWVRTALAHKWRPPAQETY